MKFRISLSVRRQRVTLAVAAAEATAVARSARTVRVQLATVTGSAPASRGGLVGIATRRRRATAPAEDCARAAREQQAVRAERLLGRHVHGGPS